MIEIALLCTIVFFIRMLPRILRPDKTDTDTWYHLSSVNSIYRNNYRLPKCNFGYILGGKYDYPFLAHWLVAFVLKNKSIKYEKFVNPFMDTLYILMGFLYTKEIIKYYNIDIDFYNFNYFLLSAFSISMLKISTGPRVNNFTPRLFGEFFIFLCFGCLHFYFLDYGAIFFVLAIIFSAFSLLTSKFSSQVVLLITPILSVLMGSYIPILVFLFSIVVADIVSFGHYREMLKQQIKHTIKYAVYGQFNIQAVRNRNKFNRYVHFIRILFSGKYKEIYSVFNSDLTFLNVLYKNFDIVIAFIVVLNMDLFDPFIRSLFFGIFILFLIISFKPFLFLGESDRYLDYLTIFSIFMIAIYLPQKYIICILVFQIVLWFFTLFLYMKSSNIYGVKYLEAMSYVEKNINNKSDYVIHAIMNNHINYSLYILTGIRSLAIEGNYGFNIIEDKKLMPYPKIYTNNFDYLYEKYGVNIIVANKKFLVGEIEYDFEKFDIFFENSDYIVYVKEEA